MDAVVDNIAAADSTEDSSKMAVGNNTTKEEETKTPLPTSTNRVQILGPKIRGGTR